MTPVSSKTEESSTTKKHLKIRTRLAIVRKIIAFQELIDTEHSKRSAREASRLLEIPNSTMQTWREQKRSQESLVELTEFFFDTCRSKLSSKKYNGRNEINEMWPWRHPRNA